MPQQIGGCFAPPIDDEKLDAYEALAEKAPPQVGDHMRTLTAMLRKFRETPASKEKPRPHSAGRGTVTYLEGPEILRMFDAVPWKEELDTYAKVFDGIDPGKDKAIRDAAFHLLWFGYELCADREPLTNDRL